MSEETEKKGSLLPMFFVMGISILIASLWDQVPIIKNSIHAVLDPTFGVLLNLNIPYGLEIGMIIIVLIITLFTTLIQKYTTDQKALKDLKNEQKSVQEEMKLHKDNPQKVAELSRKQMEFIPRTFRLTSKPLMFTGVPLILFFRWFSDVFKTLGEPKFFGVMSWFIFYLILAMVLNAILRKVLKVM